MRYLISYDIESNRARRKLVQLLLGYGIRVQKSVFEVVISTQDYFKMINMIRNLIDKEADSIRIYPIYGEAYRKRCFIGKNVEYEKMDFLII